MSSLLAWVLRVIFYAFASIVLLVTIFVAIPVIFVIGLFLGFVALEVWAFSQPEGDQSNG